LYVVTPSQSKKIDHRANAEFQIPGMVLMENAAIRVTDVIRERYPLSFFGRSGRVLVLAGCGNNGGDGLAVARHLALSGYRVTVLILGRSGKNPSGDAGTNFAILKALQEKNSGPDGVSLTVLRLEDGQDPGRALAVIREAFLIIDSLFGTGLDRPIEGNYAAVIGEANKSTGSVVAIDIPSGINGETAQIQGTAMRADDTVTFGYLKPGHILFPGRNFSGRVHLRAIGFPPDSAKSVGAGMFTLDDREAARRLRERPRDGHKGTFGRVAVLAGSTGLTGAACMTSVSALRTGAGLVTLGIPAGLQPVLAEKLTEVMTMPLEDEGQGHLIPESFPDVEELLKGKDVLALGPGCGKDPGVFEIIRNIFSRYHISIVIDADGLNQISKDKDLLREYPAPVILTPHPGEMSTLTGIATEDILKRPVETALETARKYHVIVLLKGAASVVAGPDSRVYLNRSGNPGMGTGGSGDVLTGMIASLVAQGYSPFDAAVLGCYLHGRAGDEAACRIGEAGMTAGDLMNAIPHTLKRLYALKQEEPG
jgi:NAD(P)H-hydrate epimerase